MYEAIKQLSAEIEERIRTNPLLNIDTFIIPSPYVRDPKARKDYEHSYVWIEEGEILGYILTYVSADRKEFLIYKIVTSPYGRGRGIGTAFIEYLAARIPDNSDIYIYIWEKQHETLEYFRNKGFEPAESIVYRNMVYHRLAAGRESVLERVGTESRKTPAADEIGKTRHDARKTLRTLNAMVNALAPENAGKIIEDINRETTTLINMLNAYRDSMAMAHEVNLQDLILERLVPYVGASSSRVVIRLILAAQNPVVLGHWLSIGRALVNLASNALDAMEDCERQSHLTIILRDADEQHVVLILRDNGKGIPSELLKRDENGKPAFIGISTKGKGKGEGLGTVQVWSTFSPGQIEIKSAPHLGTEWIIKFERSAKGLSKQFSSLQRRFNELQELFNEEVITKDTPRNTVITAIWQMRKKEIFLFELLEGFSRYHNIRDLYRVVLSFFQGVLDEDSFTEKVSHWKGEYQPLNSWLLATAKRIKNRCDEICSVINIPEYRGALFKSYGQSVNRVIIFTLNPETGKFLCTDRKLAEHLDFVPYLGGEKNSMLRGEFVGDMNVDSNPVYLGVWSVESMEDLKSKLLLLQKGARALLDYGIHKSKRLAFYQTTYVRYTHDINSDISISFGDFTALNKEELFNKFIREAEDELQGFLAAVE